MASLAGGTFGLQYRLIRKYTVLNSSLVSMLFATIVVPLIAVHFILPGWTDAVSGAGFSANALVFALGFGWGMGALAYAYGYNILGMALAASVLMGINIVFGSGIPLIRHWDECSMLSKVWTIAGIGLLVLGTAVSGKAGAMRGAEMARSGHGEHKQESNVVLWPTGRLFWTGILVCIVSGVLSSCANLGYEFANPLQEAMSLEVNDWRATLIRWMPMYWGGITALLIFSGGQMIRSGEWRNYFARGSSRDFAISSSMGLVHFLAQIPYGIGAFYLGTLGTTVGYGLLLGLTLAVAACLGFITGEWKSVSRLPVRVLLCGIAVLLVAMAVLAYANSLV